MLTRVILMLQTGLWIKTFLTKKMVILQSGVAVHGAEMLYAGQSPLSWVENADFFADRHPVQ